MSLPKAQRSNRHFTRTDVEAFFEKHWGAYFRKNYKDMKIISVSLLEGLTPPAWVLVFQIAHNKDEIFMRMEYLTYIFSEEKDPHTSKMSLNLVDEIKLPEGYKTVREEDVAIAKRGTTVKP